MFDLLFTLAQGPTTSPPAGADYQNYVSLGAIATALVAFWKWIAPRLDKVIDVVPQLRDLCVQNTTTLNRMAEHSAEQSRSFRMLAKVVSTLHISMTHSRKAILLVEDSTVDAMVIRNLIANFITEHRLYHLIQIEVMSLDEAFAHIPQACVVILDVHLPDSDLLTAQAFVQVCPCPVIIHSSNDYSKELAHAFAVLTKPAPAGKLVEKIEEALAATRR